MTGHGKPALENRKNPGEISATILENRRNPIKTGFPMRREPWIPGYQVSA